MTDRAERSKRAATGCLVLGFVLLSGLALGAIGGAVLCAVLR
jgi:hypothetical protein